VSVAYQFKFFSTFLLVTKSTIAFARLFVSADNSCFFATQKIFIRFHAYSLKHHDKLLRMKAKHAITLLVLGYCFDFIGGLLKILHRPYADFILILAAVLKVIGALLFLYKLTNYPKIKDFLES
jgi:hypothetical protein